MGSAALADGVASPEGDPNFPQEINEAGKKIFIPADQSVSTIPKANTGFLP